MTRGAQVQAIEWHEARRRAGAVASGAMIEEVPLVDAMGLVLARDVVARQPIPHFVSSAMDGWAVVGEGPWSVGEGEVLAAGSAWAVVTGQRLPADVRGVPRGTRRARQRQAHAGRRHRGEPG
jgi:molybdopterin molybdotransferase